MTTVLEDAYPVARKQHFCDICNGIIGIGDQYHRQRNIGDDGPYVFKGHHLCWGAWNKAYRELGLWDDEAPDWFEDIKPLVTGALRLLGVPASEREVA